LLSDDRQINRRRFFRAGLRELLKPLVNSAAPIERALREFESIGRELGQAAGSAGTSSPRARSSQTHWIRPPGALEESKFAETCSKCAICVQVCPANAIKIDTSATRGGGLPFIVPSERACVICDGLHCMQNCPSGALVFTPSVEIDIGTAQWHENLCVRRLGEDCRICVDQCPIGSAALVIEAGKVKVIEDGCTGCGVCEERCPTSPKSIVVRAKSELAAGR
jgi:ferredoxin-type protein NapG